jgi:DNA-binding GntR family transcriptional regulator
MSRSNSEPARGVVPRLHELRSLADQIYASLHTAIIHGQLAAGTRLVELDIAEQFGASQAPVREALQRLEREGLVERHARSATYVSQIVEDDLFAMLSIRTTVERFAVERTARVISPEQCTELDLLVAAMREAASQNNMVALVDHDMAFHRRLCEWSGSATLLRSWIPLFAQIERFVAQTRRRYFPDLTEVADSHLPLLDALRAHDSEAAARLVQEHIMLVWSRMEHARAQTP